MWRGHEEIVHLQSDTTHVETLLHIHVEITYARVNIARACVNIGERARHWAGAAFADQTGAHGCMVDPLVFSFFDEVVDQLCGLSCGIELEKVPRFNKEIIDTPAPTGRSIFFPAAATKRLLQARFQLFGAEIEGRVVAAVVAVDRYYPHSQLP